MKILSISTVFTFLAFFSFTQKNTVAGGGEATGVGGSVSYSIGQIDYTSNTSVDGNVNQGVQQPFELFMDEVGLEALVSIGINIYPNPTSEYLILTLKDTTKDMNYQVYDMNGRVIRSGSISSDETLIDMRPMAAGGYILSINKKSIALESVKITKQ